MLRLFPIQQKEELLVIHQMAHRIWPVTYDYMLSQEQIAYMLEWMYAPDVLKSQFEKGQLFYRIQKQDELIGFVALEPNFQNEETIKLQKFYFLPEYQNQGFGSKIFLQLFDLAQQLGFKRLILNVNKTNKALPFYLKHGMEIIDEGVFDIGQGYVMDDFILEKSWS